eukprot:CAMPEP_0113544808 /NCGR_PEP_ID=MMETSP0015_2-20120614/10908_1 /TAXON_ID=2838 /ORGANISM="Odontella" /LENGTH=50 /DNA_ID=CAMNT_0000445097 /DNA_START=94 /DNA_END=246 /DNA_ORIENTATION=- /assembly_acc=CAM_ASM_000160
MATEAQMKAVQKMQDARRKKAEKKAAIKAAKQARCVLMRKKRMANIAKRK